MKWRTWRKLRDGCSCSGVLDDTYMKPQPRPSFDAFVRYLPVSTWDYDPNEPEYSDSDSDIVSDDDADENIVNE